MTTYNFDQLDKWAKDVKEATQNAYAYGLRRMVQDVEVTPGIRRGGARVEGEIPYDTRALAQSLEIVAGGAVTTGEDAYYALSAAEIGSAVLISWGNSVVDYAAAVHYGEGGIPGSYWMTIMAAKWPIYFEEGVARYKL